VLWLVSGGETLISQARRVRVRVVTWWQLTAFQGSVLLRPPLNGLQLSLTLGDVTTSDGSRDTIA
jgi:hypothetical protein